LGPNEICINTFFGNDIKRKFGHCPTAQLPNWYLLNSATAWGNACGGLLACHHQNEEGKRGQWDLPWHSRCQNEEGKCGQPGHFCCQNVRKVNAVNQLNIWLKPAKSGQIWLNLVKSCPAD
jgi:hypothetical protein